MLAEILASNKFTNHLPYCQSCIQFCFNLKLFEPGIIASFLPILYLRLARDQARDEMLQILKSIIYTARIVH